MSGVSAATGKDPAQADGTRPSAESRKSVKKRNEIVRAATEVLNAKTYALAKMTDIAAALDLRDATLYYYFPSKQALFYACHRRSLERFEGFLAASDASSDRGIEKLESLFRTLLVDSVEHGSLLYFGDYFHLEAGNRRLIAAWAGRLNARLELFLKQGIEDGSIEPCDTRLVVNLILGMLIWLARWTDSVPNLSADELLQAIMTLVFRGLDARNR